MGQQDEVRYGERTLDKWVDRAWDGKIAVTDFQRSFVWEPARTAKYLGAILSGKPVGLYLILDRARKPQFAPRAFKDFDGRLGAVEELVLDGQQRLTSLLHVLYGNPKFRFFVVFKDLSAPVLEPRRVVAVSRKTVMGKRLDNPVEAYRRNHLPVDVLRRRQPDEEMSRLAWWCGEVGQNAEEIGGHHGVTLLREKIGEFAEQRLFQRKMYSCWLPASTSRASAVDMFVETNISSVRITAFDEEVARARGERDEDLRKAIQGAYKRSGVLKYYFSDDPEEWIPEVGEWMLKVGCLHKGLAPKKGNYGDAVAYLLGGDGGEGERLSRLRGLFKDLDWALKEVSSKGAPTRGILPSWPPVHVLAAVRSRFEAIKDPAQRDVARRLIGAYYWRCLFSSRHEARANDRLHQDFLELAEALEDIDGEWPKLSAFDRQDHPLYTSSQLIRYAKWIGSNRVGRAIASAVLARKDKPVDWMTGDVLDATMIRDLEESGNLDRHHIFPREFLREGGVRPERINHGLNGVILGRSTNKRLWKLAPSEYIDRMLEQLDVDQEELAERIEGHFVPFEEMDDDKGTVKLRYERFLKQRARRMFERVKELATLP